MYTILKVIFIQFEREYQMFGAFLLTDPREISIPDIREYNVALPEGRAREILNKVCEEYGYELVSATHENEKGWRVFFYYLKKVP